MAYESATEKQKLDSGLYAYCICNNLILKTVNQCPFCRNYRKIVGSKCPRCGSKIGELQETVKLLEEANKRIVELEKLIPEPPPDQEATIITNTDDLLRKLIKLVETTAKPTKYWEHAYEPVGATEQIINPPSGLGSLSYVSSQANVRAVVTVSIYNSNEELIRILKTLKPIGPYFYADGHTENIRIKPGDYIRFYNDGFKTGDSWWVSAFWKYKEL